MVAAMMMLMVLVASYPSSFETLLFSQLDLALSPLTQLQQSARLFAWHVSLPTFA